MTPLAMVGVLVIPEFNPPGIESVQRGWQGELLQEVLKAYKVPLPLT